MAQVVVRLAIANGLQGLGGCRFVATPHRIPPTHDADANQDADNGNNDHQFDEGKSARIGMIKISLSHNNFHFL
jgi:hypothetical protein